MDDWAIDLNFLVVEVVDELFSFIKMFSHFTVFKFFNEDFIVVVFVIFIDFIKFQPTVWRIGFDLWSVLGILSSSLEFLLLFLHFFERCALKDLSLRTVGCARCVAHETC